MAVTEVYGSVTINKLVNGDNLIATLYETGPLYQTFKKGTQDFVPNWATMPDGDRPVIFPRVYATTEAKEVVVTDIGWKYNQQPIIFNSSGVATAPDVCANKIRKVTHNNNEALKLIGNIASDTNNTSDTVTMTGKVVASGQELWVSAETTIVVEEASIHTYRLILAMPDHVIDGAETSLKITAHLYNSNNLVETGVQYEFTDLSGNILRAKGASKEFNIHKDAVNGDLIVVCKAYVDNTVVAEAQRLVIDLTDPYQIECDAGRYTTQDTGKDVTYTFNLLNQRTGTHVPNASFVIRVFKLKPTSTEITSEFTRTSKTVVIPGAKIDAYDSINIVAGPVTIP